MNRVKLVLPGVVLAIFVGGMAGMSSGAEKIIFDTDMYGDYDDVGALALLHDYADRGQVEILATISCTVGDTNNKSVAVCEILNAFYGRPGIPVGVSKAANAVGRDHREKNQRRGFGLCEKYAEWIRHPAADDAEDAVRVYRRLLAAAEDRSVTIVSVGFLTNLAELLKSSADEFSSLDGKALVARKVKKWVAMACAYPQGRECNSMWDAPASKIVLDEWPTPAYFTDYTYGSKVHTGRILAESALKDNPVADAFRHCLKPRTQLQNPPPTWDDTVDGHPSWDQTAILLAVEDPERLFGLERGCYRMVGDDGTNTWTDDPQGRHVRIVEKVPYAEIGRMIDLKMMTAGLERQVREARFGKTEREAILADAERAFRTHFDDDRARTAAKMVRYSDEPNAVAYLDGWISPAMGAWQGEFWGKYLLGAVETAEQTGDAELKAWLKARALAFVKEFQAKDGYLSSYADREFLGGPRDSRHAFAWNVWGRKYTLWALLEIARVADAPELVEAARRLADQLIAQLAARRLEVRETGCFAGLASGSVLLPMVRLYRMTGEKRYLAFAKRIVAEWDREDGACPNLIRNASSGRPVHTWYPDPGNWAKAYEMMSCLEGVLDYADAVGGAEKDRLVEAVKRIRDLLAEHELNPLGSVGDGDHFLGLHGTSDKGTELCDVIHWMRLNAALDRVSGDRTARDYVLRAFARGVLGAVLDHGRWSMQYVKTDGTGKPADLQVDMKRHHCCVDNLPRAFTLVNRLFTAFENGR